MDLVMFGFLLQVCRVLARLLWSQREPSVHLHSSGSNEETENRRQGYRQNEQNGETEIGLPAREELVMLPGQARAWLSVRGV